MSVGHLTGCSDLSTHFHKYDDVCWERDGDQIEARRRVDAGASARRNNKEMGPSRPNPTGGWGLRAISLSFVVNDASASPPPLFATSPRKTHPQTSSYLWKGVLSLTPNCRSASLKRIRQRSRCLEDRFLRCRPNCDRFTPSGHRQREKHPPGLRSYVKPLKQDLKGIFLVHGEEKAAFALRDGLFDAGVKRVEIPEWNEVVEI